jgi:hypothetical protein
MSIFRLMVVRILLVTSLLVPSMPQPVWSAMTITADDGVMSTLPNEELLAKRTSPRAASASAPVNSQGMSRGMKPPEELRLNLEGRDIVIIYSTGSVQLGEGITVDDASRDFWRKVAELAPSFCQEKRQATTPK